MKQHIQTFNIVVVNAAIVVYIAVIAYNTIFKFFTVRVEFLLKWRNQIHICNENASSATAMVSTGENIIQFGILILDTLKVKFLDILKVNTRLNAFKFISVS